MILLILVRNYHFKNLLRKRDVLVIYLNISLKINKIYQ